MSTHPYSSHVSFFFFFNDTATTEIYTLSLHDALPISSAATTPPPAKINGRRAVRSRPAARAIASASRSEEHTSELQSQSNLVCRLLLEKKNTSVPSMTHTLIAYQFSALPMSHRHSL